jgi:uncharacterized protein (TIGR02599 family)
LSATGTTVDSAGGSSWLANIKNGSGQNSVYVTPLADNVIALVIWPRLAAEDEAAQTAAGTYTPLSTDYTYDSQANPTPTFSPTYGYTQNITAEQLPPDLQVTMVVLDEASAARLQGTSTTIPAGANEIMNGLFTMSDTTDYENDMKTLVTRMSTATSTHPKLNFEIFNTTVAMRESKWSTPQQ